MTGYRHWTDAERASLLKLKADGATRREIARLLGRTWRAVKHQLETWRYE